MHELAQTQGSGAILFSVGENVSLHSPKTRFGVIYELVGIHPIIAPEAPIQGERSGSRRSNKGNAGEQASRQPTEQEKAERAAKSKAELAEKLSESPKWLLVLDRNSAFGERDNSNKLLSANSVIIETEAWKNNRVVHLSGSGWYLVGGGVTQLLRTIDQLEATFSNAPNSNP